MTVIKGLSVRAQASNPAHQPTALLPSPVLLSSASFQDKIVPEYAFLEPRGMGIFDGKEAAAVLPEARLVMCYFL